MTNTNGAHSRHAKFEFNSDFVSNAVNLKSLIVEMTKPLLTKKSKYQEIANDLKSQYHKVTG